MLGVGTMAHGTERLHFSVQSSHLAYLQSGSGCPRTKSLVPRGVSSSSLWDIQLTVTVY
jgi:hypothetical protein